MVTEVTLWRFKHQEFTKNRCDISNHSTDSTDSVVKMSHVFHENVVEVVTNPLTHQILLK